MTRLNRAVIALAVCGGLFAAAPLFAQATAPAQKDQAAAPTKFISPIRGDADIQVLPTVTKVLKGSTVVTTITIKNVSMAPIAGLKVEEFWWDKSNNPAAGGDVGRAKKPIMPGEVYTFTLQDEKDANMFRNTYTFSHANGKIRAKQVKKF